MRCPFCQQQESRVLDSRLARQDTAVKRRRECSDCGRRWTTYETAEERQVLVVKRDGRREPFDRAKIRMGLEIACRKRPVSAAALDGIVDQIERRLIDSGEAEIDAHDLGEMVIGEIKQLDPVAYVRFASVYRNFQDVAEFQDFLGRLHTEPGGQMRQRRRSGSRRPVKRPDSITASAAHSEQK